MRFIGNKENIIERINSEFIKNGVVGNSIFDFFAGTTSVSRFFKKNGYSIFSSDLMYFSYVLQQAYILNNDEPSFNKIINKLKIKDETLFSNSNLEKVVSYLNKLEPIKGFIYKNYSPGGTSYLSIPRMYFSDENAMIIDSIRIKIQEWYDKKLITVNEYYILIACLVETTPYYANISGVYAAFQKKWDPRSIKKFILRPIEIIIGSSNNHKAWNTNSAEIIGEVKADIYYLDPPYNQRQYAPNYHILETIARYDNPKIKGVTGIREYDDQKSKFCNPKTGIEELDKISKIGNFKYLVMSYNSEGIMNQDDIIDCLSKYGKVNLVEFDYLRFKSNNNGDSKNKKYIKEQLFILKK